MDLMVNTLQIKNSLIREALAEFLGTFLLMVFSDGAVAQSLFSEGKLGESLSIHWSQGVGVMMGVYASGGASGGHINPAVTVALSCIGRFPFKKVPAYLLSQYLGSFVASFFVYVVYYDAINHFDNGTRATDGAIATAGVFATYPEAYLSVLNSIGDQIFGTAILMICVSAITDDRNMNPAKGLKPICIGLLIFAINITYCMNCGCANNPARDLGPRIFTATAGWGIQPFSYNDYSYFWVPILGPHIGAIIGAYIYHLFIGLHWPDEDKTESGNDESLRKNEIMVKPINFTVRDKNGYFASKSDDNVPLIQRNSVNNNDMDNEVVWVKRRHHINILNNTETYRRKGNIDYDTRESVL